MNFIILFRNVYVAGISMEGDDVLLAETEVKVEPKRDEWMTTLPPERKVSPVNPIKPRHSILVLCHVLDTCQTPTLVRHRFAMHLI